MKSLIGIGVAVLGLAFSASVVLANPSMLPKHPGYPAKAATSPVTNQPVANDPGQSNAVGEKAAAQAAGAEDNHTMQSLQDPNNARIVKQEGAGQLPSVSGPQIKIQPPVKEATRMK